MIGLNLLSPTQKEALRARVLYAMLERLMISVVAASLLAATVLLLIKIQLAKNLSQIEGRQILTAEYVTVNNEVKALDRQIARVDALQRLAVSPSALMRDLAVRTPSGIAIASINYEIATGEMHLTGIAARREDLLAYETELKKSAFIKKLDSPISNLFQKTEVNFQFTISLNVEAMKKAYEPTP